MSKQNVVAILSSTVLTLEGDYRYVPIEGIPAMEGIPHYVGHPATRHILDAEGAVYTPGLFKGLEVGECFLVAQLKDPRKGAAFTVDSPNVELSDMKWGAVVRLA